jgi:hypothetical protein
MGYDDVAGRDLYALDLAGVDDAAATISLPSRYFVCLLAGAMHRLSEGEIHRLARRLLDGGAVYLIAWGPAAGRTHGLLRDAVLIAERSQAEDTVVMTSEYGGTLDDALVFLLSEATPSAAYLDSCRAALVVTVDAAVEASLVARVLEAPAEFLARMTAPG